MILVRRHIALAGLFLALFLAMGHRTEGQDIPQPAKKAEDLNFKHARFTFVRIRHSDAAGGRRGGSG